MATSAALLRGVNVGGRNKVPMGELTAALSSLGLEDVVTYIQSGNVVFRSPSGDTRELASGIERRITEVFGLGVTVLLRTPAELDEIAGGNPFLADQANRAKLHVVFLDALPAAGAVEALDPNRSPPDRFSVRGREVYLQLPNGAGRSKLTLDYFERRLGARATVLNWNTLLEMISLARAAQVRRCDDVCGARNRQR